MKVALTCLCLLVPMLAATSVQAATNASAYWTGGGGANQNWSSAANWATGANLQAPPANPFTPYQAVLGNGSGDVDFYTGGGTPGISTMNVDVPWKIAVLYVGNNRNGNIYGQDLTIQQACLANQSATLSAAAIQIQNNSQAHSLNITNNVIFDDAFYVIDTNYIGHSIVQVQPNSNTGTPVGNCSLNFYGNVSLTTTNGFFIIRSTAAATFAGGLTAPLTPNFNIPAIGLWNVNVAMLGNIASSCPTVTFPKANNSWKYMNVDRGNIVIGTNNALPVASWFWFGDTPGRPVIFTMNDWDQTFESVFDTGATPTQARTIDTGSGAGGTLTINDNGLTNEWIGIVMTGNGRLVKNGLGKLSIRRNQTFTGATTIGGGVLQLGVGVTGGLLGAGVNITNNGTLIINSTDNFTGGNLYGTGGLQKLTANSVNFGAASYAGNTYLAGGTLTIGGGDLSPSPSITLSNGATLDLSATVGLTRSSGQSLNGSGTVSGTVNAQAGSSVTIGNSVGTLNLGGSVTLGGTTLNMELSSDPTTIGGGVNDLLSVANTLTLASPSTIYITPLGALSTTTPYKIIQYSALVGPVNNLTAILPFAGRYAFTVQDANPYIQVAVSSTLNGNLLWHGGAAGNPTRWDVTTTTNWLNGANPDTYIINDPVGFDDTALTNRVTLAANVTSPSLVASNNSLSYTIDGSGSLTVANLSMNGLGSLTVANTVANNLGNVTMNAGTLIISNSAANTFGNVGITNNTLAIANSGSNSFASIGMGGGIFRFNQPANATLSTPIVGSAGTVIKEGANTLTMAANNGGFTGAIQINGGVLKATATNALGDGVAVINSGGSLEFNYPVDGSLDLGAADVMVQGAGAGLNGAIYSAGAYQAYVLKNITLTGDTSFGGGWENIGGAFTGGGFKVTKVGAGDVFIESKTLDTDFGDVEIVQGLFGIESTGTTFGRTNNTITVRSNATLAVYACSTAGNKNIVMDDGARISVGGGAGGPSAYGGTMTLNGTTHVLQYNANTASLHTYNGTISGPGTLSIDGILTYVLAAENINSGGFVVTNGALRAIHSMAFSTNMTVELRTNGVVSGAVIVGTTVPRIELSDGVIIPSGVTIKMYSDGAGSCRTTLGVAAATTGEFQGTVIPHGDGVCALVANNSASVFTQSGPYTNMNFTGTCNLRGAGNGFISGQIKIGGNLGHNPSSAGTWTISSTGNQWANTSISASRLILGTNDALCITAPVGMAANGTLDLAGFNQTVISIDGNGGGTGVIGNSSSTSDSLLTINGNGTTNITTITNAIVDTIGAGTMKVAVTITNTTVRTFAVNTYTGPTLVKNGGLLGGNATLASAVTVESGGTISPGASIGVMTINNTLTLNAGSTSLMEVTHPPANDGVLGLVSVTYGGTLVVTNIGVSPLVAGDSFPLFQAGAYNGSFANIILPALNPGLVWNTNNLSVNGTLSVVATAPPHVDTVTRLPDGNVQLTLSGPSGAGYSIHASTNVALPLTNWPVINTGTISTSPFNYSDLSATNFTRRFYRMSIP